MYKTYLKYSFCVFIRKMYICVGHLLNINDMKREIVIFLTTALSALLLGSAVCRAQSPSLRVMDVSLSGTTASIANALCASQVITVNRKDLKIAGKRINGNVSVFDTEWTINIEVLGGNESMPVIFTTHDLSHDVFVRTVEGLKTFYGEPSKSSTHDAMWNTPECFIHVRPLGDEGWMIVF